MEATEERTLTIVEAAKALGVGRQVIYRMLRDGDLTTRTNPFYKKQSPGHRIPLREIEAKLALLGGYRD